MSNRQFLRTLKMRSTLVAAACLMVATPSLAQQAQPVRTGAATGMRYLSWAGKADSVAVPLPVEAPRAAPASDGLDRKSTRLNSSHCTPARMPSSA